MDPDTARVQQWQETPSLLRDLGFKLWSCRYHVGFLGSDNDYRMLNRHFHQPIRKLSGLSKGYSSSNRDERTQ